MERIKTVVVANRGEISTRIIKSVKKVGIRSIALYTEADAASTHVLDADESVLLPGGNAKGYLDGDAIIDIAKKYNADAIIPGYGFLSENASFAHAVSDAGIAWVGPSPATIKSFGIKHTARELAAKAGVPIVPGSNGLIESEEDAVREAETLGFPIMLKATAGGGGMGLLTCQSAPEVREAYATVKCRGEALFKNGGLFMERFYPDSHHIEVQVFGNGQGSAIHFGERECSIQRRHQKVIEECPSPFVERHPALRQKICEAAVRLAESIKYGSAGTIEYLVDNKSVDFFFLEMNTRLQVEHGITELCYNVDLVKLMLEQADAEIGGKGGIDPNKLKSLQPSEPQGCAIEARVYAENPARDYAPAPGVLQLVNWKDIDGSRLDTWVRTGTIVSSNYDPLLAKMMFHAPNRNCAIAGMHEILTQSRICGPPTNLDFIASILDDPRFNAGETMTKFLTDFQYAPAAIQVISGGAHTTVQDFPGRPSMGRGFPHAGPMDPLAFQVANLLVGNARGTEGLEITLDGPELLFLGAAVVAVCGAPIDVKVDGRAISMWTRTRIEAGQKLKIGGTTNGGCRSYLALHGGLPSVAEWFGSKATSPGVRVGGLQGRALASGDLLALTKVVPDTISGPCGAHPSNVAEYGYPVGTLNWTGDDPCIFPVDCPDFGGFVSSTTIVKGEFWRLGQMKAGDTMQYREVSLQQALEIRARIDQYIGDVGKACSGKMRFNEIEPLDYEKTPLSARSDKAGDAIVHQIASKDKQPLTTYRQGGDDYLLVEYGHGNFDLNHRCRVTALNKALKESRTGISFSNDLTNTVGCCNTLLIHYNGLRIPQARLIEQLISLESSIGDLSHAKVPSRIFKLPITFDTSGEKEAIKRYMETQRPYASYLPDNMEFVAKNNGLEKKDLKQILLGNELIAVSVGFFAALPLCLPVDPRRRIYCPKFNPSRVFTPEGQVSWGGACMALYNVESPGGYQLTGRTIPGVDILGSKKGYSLARPWLFEDFDQLSFHEVSEEEYEKQLALFHSGRYEYQVENTVFDMAEHNTLLEQTKDEVAQIRKKQSEAQKEMDRVEAHLMEKWTREKAEGKIPVDKIEALLNDPAISQIPSPLNANVWKVIAREGDILKGNDVVAILEAMKLEITVRANDEDGHAAGSTIEKIL
ncbi:MAG: hypothetical protein Q9191_002204, partial [Dirinaria sp. TL-2023a]